MKRNDVREGPGIRYARAGHVLRPRTPNVTNHIEVCVLFRTWTKSSKMGQYASSNTLSCENSRRSKRRLRGIKGRPSPASARSSPHHQLILSITALYPLPPPPLFLSPRKHARVSPHLVSLVPFELGNRSPADHRPPPFHSRAAEHHNGPYVPFYFVKEDAHFAKVHLVIVRQFHLSASD